ncbi:hypothetical protein K438DRAFT_1761765 [Mycena galopus ATCC 62051]|nr:hypothetical protein K438DRAFT_1761765 [Mycena galopus ATCC 62051]
MVFNTKGYRACYPPVVHVFAAPSAENSARSHSYISDLEDWHWNALNVVQFVVNGVNPVAPPTSDHCWGTDEEGLRSTSPHRLAETAGIKDYIFQQNKRTKTQIEESLDQGRRRSEKNAGKRTETKVHAKKGWLVDPRDEPKFITVRFCVGWNEDVEAKASRRLQVQVNTDKYSLAPVFGRGAKPDHYT